MIIYRFICIAGNEKDKSSTECVFEKQRKSKKKGRRKKKMKVGVLLREEEQDSASICTHETSSVPQRHVSAILLIGIKVFLHNIIIIIILEAAQ